MIPNTLDSIDCNPHWIRSMANYHGDLFIEGAFLQVSGLGATSSGLARWDGLEWYGDGAPNSNGNKLVGFDDDLWFIGGYDSLAGQPCGSLSYFENGQWHCIETPPPNAGLDQFRAICRYQGKLYAAGNLTGLLWVNDILYLDGTEWLSPGPGIYGGNAFVNTLAAFDGKLFVGGAFDIADGNPGKNLMTWDGTNWSAFFPAIVTAASQVMDMEVIHGKLYFAGRFRFVGDNAYYHVIQYDGQNLCAVGKSYSTDFLGAYDLAGNSNELYFADYFSILANDTVNHLAKWVYADGADTCVQVFTGVVEPTASSDQSNLLAWFNEGGQSITFSVPKAFERSTIGIELFDTAGKLLFTEDVRATGNTAQLRTNNLPNGMYVGHLRGTSYTFKAVLTNTR